MALSFRQSTREKRIFSEDQHPGGSLMRVEPVAGTIGVRSGCQGSWSARVPVDSSDPDVARLDNRRERVLFSVPRSKLLEKYNVEED